MKINPNDEIQSGKTRIMLTFARREQRMSNGEVAELMRSSAENAGLNYLLSGHQIRESEFLGKADFQFYDVFERKRILGIPYKSLVARAYSGDIPFSLGKLDRIYGIPLVGINSHGGNFYEDPEKDKTAQDHFTLYTPRLKRNLTVSLEDISQINEISDAPLRTLILAMGKQLKEK